MSRYRFTIHPFERRDLASDEALADYAEFGNNLTQDDNKMADNPYWLVSGLSYEDASRIASESCVEHFQHDAASGTTKLWPGSPEVYYLLLHEVPPHTIIDQAGSPYKHPEGHIAQVINARINLR